jgi:hypothetical protein
VNSSVDVGPFEMSPTTLQRIFWPVYATRGRNAPGWIAGWMNSETDYFVFAVLSEESVKVPRVVTFIDSRLTPLDKGAR